MNDSGTGGGDRTAGSEEPLGANGGTTRDGTAGAEDPGAKERISDGMRQGLGVLSAFKDALEETIREARERGDLSSDRARGLMRDAMSRAREAAGEARERLDFATHDELERLREHVDELRVRLENLEARVPQSPDVGPAHPVEEGPEA